MIDLSILIVHYNTPGLLRQTLKGLRQSAPQLKYEIIVVDNNPQQPVAERLRLEFPEVKVIVNQQNVGFGRGMNQAMIQAEGRYSLIFNPDIALFAGTLEKLLAYMDEHPEIGMLGPQLNHPDGSLQYSCYRFMKPSTILYRRLPFMTLWPKAKKAVAEYLMEDWDHEQTRAVDYLLGAVMLVRREAIEQVGGFDPNYFVYFEDQDLCRRFWLAGWPVVYYPEAKVVHYHRRETAAGNFLSQLLNPLTRIQMKSALYYYKKYQGQENPRLNYQQNFDYDRISLS
ncbi:glycosyltransferase family 2 protein [Patescibacteria group bacterium]|nr:glycosyltransferase family 2 protein [Patescibacteria group bacterium]MBU1705752.1 glycosyltransferase family 2 protein [Patescibacteria group bacterium]